MSQGVRRWGRMTLLGALAALLTGCGEGLGDLQQFVQQTRAKPPGRIEPIPEFQPYQNFEYTSHDLRDPFKLVDFRRPEELEEEISETATGPRPDANRILDALSETSDQTDDRMRRIDAQVSELRRGVDRLRRGGDVLVVGDPEQT